MRHTLITAVLGLAPAALAQQSDRVEPAPPVDQATVDQAMQRLQAKQQARQQEPSAIPDNLQIQSPNNQAQLAQLRLQVQALNQETQALRQRLLLVSNNDPQVLQFVRDLQQQTQRAFTG